MKNSLHIMSFIVMFSIGASVASLDKPKSHLPNQTQHSANVAEKSFLSSPFPIRSGSTQSDAETLQTLMSILQETGTLKVASQLVDTLQASSSDQCARLLERIMEMDSHSKQMLIPAVLERWKKINSDAADHWINKYPNPFVFWSLWSQFDPNGALQFAFAHPDAQPDSMTMVQRAVRDLAGDSPGDQAAYLNKLPACVVRNRVLMETIRKWLTSDASSAAKFVETLPLDLRETVLLDTAAWLAKVDGKAALDLVDRQPESKSKREALEKTILNVADQDPQLALKRASELLSKISPGLYGNDFVNEFANILAGKDIQAASEWVESLPPGLNKDPLIAVGKAWAKNEPLVALEWSLAHGVDLMQPYCAQYRQSSASSVLKEAMLNHPEETANWILAQPAGPERDRMVEGALQYRANAKSEEIFASPKEVMMELFAALPDDAQARNAGRLGRKIGFRNDFDLNEWTARFPDGPAQEEAVIGAMQSVAAKNRKNAEILLENIKDPIQHDYAVAGIALSLKDVSPLAAMNRALEIQDPNVRYSALNRLVPDWLTHSPAEARTWLDNATFPQNWKSAWKLEASFSVPAIMER